MRKNRKGKIDSGQLETFGLVVLVVLILIIALIAARFLLAEEREQIEVKKSVIANNLFNALLKVNVNECGQMSELLIKCYESIGKISACDCKLVGEVVKTITANLEMDENLYKLDASADGSNFLSIGKCSGGVKASSYQAHRGGNNYNFELILCWA